MSNPFFLASVADSIRLTALDWSVVGIYAVVVLTVGLLVGRRPGTSESCFSAGRSLRWPMIGASLFAANISAEHFVYHSVFYVVWCAPQGSEFWCAGAPLRYLLFKLPRFAALFLNS